MKSAWESGAEVIINLRYECDTYIGRIQDVDKEHFTLFQSGTKGGVLWVFLLENVVSCGLRVKPPHDESIVTVTGAPSEASEEGTARESEP